MDGPWFVGDQNLHVQAWESDFHPGMAKVTSTVVWIWLEQLPIEYYHQEFLRHVGTKIGKLLRIDAVTNTATRGRFAELCVQINLHKPLPKPFKVGTFWQDIMYENVLYYATSVASQIGNKEASCLESSVSMTTHAHIGSSPCLEEASKLLANHSLSPWKIVHNRRPRVRGVF